FAHSPLVLFYELTRACDLVCNHCRACAQSVRSPYELTNSDSRRLIEAIATFPKPPLLVLTGGDPLKRPDVFDLIEHARAFNLSVAITPSATPLVTREAMAQFSALGVNRLAVSLDGADAATHDAVRGWSGSF